MCKLKTDIGKYMAGRLHQRSVPLELLRKWGFANAVLSGLLAVLYSSGE